MKYILISLFLLFTQTTVAGETYPENVRWRLDMEKQNRELQTQNAELKRLLAEKFGVELEGSGESGKVLGVYNQTVVLCDCLKEDVNIWPEGIMPYIEEMDQAMNKAEESCQKKGGSLGVCNEIP